MTAEPDPVRTALEACFGHLGDGEIALGQFELAELAIVGRRMLAGGETELSCRVAGILRGIADPFADSLEIEHALTVTIVLDATGRIALDRDGRPRFGPWRVRPPQLWNARARAHLPAGWLAHRSLDARSAAVLRRVAACLGGVVGPNGDLGAYTLEPATFEIIGTRAVEPEAIEYRFAARAWLETEHDGPESGPPRPSDAGELLRWLVDGVPLHEPMRGSHRIEGAIVLDAELALTRDDRGSVRISPWTCLDPERD